MDYSLFIYNEKELEFLRENTKLDPVSYIKLLRLKSVQDRYPVLYKRFNKEANIKPDYTDVNLFEYNARVKAWINSCRKAWEEYIFTEFSGMNLWDFARNALDLAMEKPKIRRK